MKRKVHTARLNKESAVKALMELIKEEGVAEVTATEQKT